MPVGRPRLDVGRRVGAGPSLAIGDPHPGGPCWISGVEGGLRGWRGFDLSAQGSPFSTLSTAARAPPSWLPAPPPTSRRRPALGPQAGLLRSGAVCVPISQVVRAVPAQGSSSPLALAALAGMWARRSLCAWVFGAHGVERPSGGLGVRPASPLLLCPLFNLCLPQFPPWGGEGDGSPHPGTASTWSR